MADINSKPLALREEIKELLMSGMTSLKQENLLYDVQFQVEETIFPAHRFVLAASSNFFKAMFTRNFRESREFSDHPIALKGISPAGFKVFLDFVYMANPGFTSENIIDAIHVAQMYQVELMIKACEQFLQNDVDAKKFYHYFHIAKENNFQAALDHFEEYKCINFLKICKTAGFVELGVEEVTEYLKHPNLVTGGKEINVVNAASDWIKHAPDQRMKFGADLLKCINLLNLSIDELMYTKNIIKAETQDCQNMFAEALSYLQDIFIQPFYKGSLLNNRGCEGMMFIPSYEDINRLQEQCKDMFNNIDTNVCTPYWTGLPLEVEGNELENDLSEVTSDSISKLDFLLDPISYTAPRRTITDYVKMGNFLFVFILPYGKRIDVLRFNPSIDKWMSLKAPPDVDKRLDWICVAQCGEKSIMVMFGRGSRPTAYDQSGLTGKVYKYSIQENSWKFIDNVPNITYKPTLAYHHSTVYLFSGTRLCKFDPRSNTWMDKAPFQCKRSHHVGYAPVKLIPIDDKLYVFSGDCVGEYDIVNNQWSILADDVVRILQGSCEMPLLWDSCFMHNNMVYIIAEEAEEAGRYAPACVYKCDISKKTYSVCQKILPWGIQCYFAAMVHAPRW